VDARVRVAQVEDLLDDGAVLALELGGLDAGRLLVGPLLDLDAQAAVGACLRRAGDPAVETGEGRGLRAAGKPDDARRLGDGADVRVRPVVHRHEEDALAFGDVDGQRHRHVREDDRLLEGDQQELVQRVLLHFSHCRYFND
jgi:hypothetical protein